MPKGEITGYIDAAQITLYVFFVFFAGLCFWLRREDRREGYPLEAEAYGRLKNPDPVLIPTPKAFHLSSGRTMHAPQTNVAYDTDVAGRKREPWPGAPYFPTGNPMEDRIGPGSWAKREDTHDHTWEGEKRIVPLRNLDHFVINESGPNPIGMPVLGVDRRVAGKISDVWVDRGESLIRYYEVELPEGGRKVLMPQTFCKITVFSRFAKTEALLAEQFAGIPPTKEPDAITLQEEERIVSYFGAGTLYATPHRAEPRL